MKNSNKHYTASLSQTQNRTGWSIIFRHPVRQDDSTGKPGKRIRRGLGTRDESEAEKLRKQINEILSEPRFWEPSARAEASERFEERVVSIFYQGMIPEIHDYFNVRESFLPLPSSENSDYRRALFLGTTGAGKTTLVRQLLGTDPNTERFPSTSTAKTTVADMEVILSSGQYQAVVTFVSSDELREHIKECASKAVLAAYKGESDQEILRKLLNHVSQRFRFNYILGDGPLKPVSDFDDDDDDDVEQSTPDGNILSEALDLDKTNTLLLELIKKVRQISKVHGSKLKSDLEAHDESDERVIDELFEDELDELLREDESFHYIIDHLVDEIEQRFNALSVGQIQRTRQGWPLTWSWKCDDRDEFIKTVSLFSSNYSKFYGYLLTPLVNGIRISGAFAPNWLSGETPKLVLLDGEGLGHTKESATALSTSIMRRIEDVDAVVLVDNAAQPMQAAPVAAMKQLVSMGNAAKLLVAFTHFDEVKGDNLPNAAAKAQHVLDSAENVFSSIGEELGPFAERALRKRLEEGRFFLEAINLPLSLEEKPGKRTIAQITKLLASIDKIVDRAEPSAARPSYDKINLVLAIKTATENFHNAWLCKLGIKPKPGFVKEHWTRIKALTRRLATPGWDDEYDGLQPVADLRIQLQNQIYIAIQNPLSWSPSPPSDDEKQQIFDDIADRISKELVELSTKRIRMERAKEWQDAFNKNGRGSTFERATIIAKDIYDRAAPIPDSAPSPERNRFLHEVIHAASRVMEEIGADLE